MTGQPFVIANLKGIERDTVGLRCGQAILAEEALERECHVRQATRFLESRRPPPARILPKPQHFGPCARDRDSVKADEGHWTSLAFIITSSACRSEERRVGRE